MTIQYPIPQKTKEECFEAVDGEKNIPIDRTRHPFEFSRNWFKLRNQKTWSTYLKPWSLRLGHPINMLQIGVFEGMDLVWCLQNIIDIEDSRVVAIDPWLATRKIDQDGMDEVRRRATKNLAPWADIVHIEWARSQDLLPQLADEYPEFFDLVVIDGDHKGPAVYADAKYSYPLLKEGGLMLFDDVRMKFDKPDEVPAGLAAIDADKDINIELCWQHRYCDCYRKI